MRLVSSTILLAFFVSWLAAEWPRTTRRVVTGAVERFDNGSLVVGSYPFQLPDSLIVISGEGASTVTLQHYGLAT
jgi:hypothetical protein